MAGTDRVQAGLTSAQAAKLLEQYGKNELTSGKKGKFLRKALHILGEPMFLLLFFAAVVYFILGEPKDGAVMFIFITGVVGIDVMQEWKTDRTLAALQKMTPTWRGLTAPSANTFGRISPSCAAHVAEDLGVKPEGKLDLILDGGNCEFGIESTMCPCKKCID